MGVEYWLSWSKLYCDNLYWKWNWQILYYSVIYLPAGGDKNDALVFAQSLFLCNRLCYTENKMYKNKIIKYKNYFLDKTIIRFLKLKIINFININLSVC